MKKLFFYCTVLLLGGLYACSEDEVFTTTAIDKSKALVKSEILNDTIIPLEGMRSKEWITPLNPQTAWSLYP